MKRAISGFVTIWHMKLSNSNRIIAIAAAAILTSAYQLSPIPAWACSASSSGGFAYSSNTGPTSVTVCAQSVVNTRVAVPAAASKAPVSKAPAAKAPVAKAPAAKAPVIPKSAPKVPPTPAKSLLTPIKQGVPASLQKPVAKPVPKPVSKPIVVSTPSKTPAKSIVTTSSTSTATSSGEVSFSPAPISLTSSETRAQVGQEVTFWAATSTHYKTGMLLGKVTDVRFTPIETEWSSDQGHAGAGAAIALTFDDEGSVEVMASVTYAVAYQISGASGWVSSGEILVSDSIALTIVNAPEALTRTETPPSKVVRLVGKNCLTRTAVFGCNP